MCKIKSKFFSIYVKKFRAMTSSRNFRFICLGFDSIYNCLNVSNFIIKQNTNADLAINELK